MSTKEEQRSAFLWKRTEFRTHIRRLADDQKADKTEFRATKKAPVSPDREGTLARQRAGIVQTRSAIRYFLLAYAMFRGKSYAKVEQKCNDKADPYHVWVIFKRLDLHEQYDKAQIETWLSGGVLPRTELSPLSDPVMELPAAAVG